jgi:hypothetical protein
MQLEFLKLCIVYMIHASVNGIIITKCLLNIYFQKGFLDLLGLRTTQVTIIFSVVSGSGKPTTCMLSLFTEAAANLKLSVNIVQGIC